MTMTLCTLKVINGVKIASPAAFASCLLQRDVPSRNHSHSTMSVKRKIPPPPNQPKDKDKYFVDYNPPGALQGWANWHMKKDYRRRQTVIEFGCERKLINTIRKNSILPREIKEIADKEIVDLPRDSTQFRLVGRCCISSRPRGVIAPWRLSRFFFRHLVDYNKMAGVQRGIW